jgi:hypothetical protein
LPEPEFTAPSPPSDLAMSAAKELDNANPTVLSASELPTRRLRKDRDASSKVEGIRAILMANPTDTLDPFYLSDFSDTDSDDSSIQPIDEQEIYGKSKVSHAQAHSRSIDLLHSQED